MPHPLKAAALAAFIALASSQAWAAGGSNPETPFELGVLRGASATTRTLSELSDVARWGTPLSATQRADTESFRRINPYRQLSYAHWGYVRAVKSYLAALSTSLRSLSAGLAPVPNPQDNTPAAFRTVSPEVRSLLQRYAEGLAILGRPNVLVEPAVSSDGAFIAGHEVFAATLATQGAQWSSRLTEEMGSQAGVLSRLAGLFSKKPQGGAVADSLMQSMIKQHGPRAVVDHDAGLVLSGRALLQAITVVTEADTDSVLAAFRDVRSRRNDPAIEQSLSEDDEGVLFLDEDVSALELAHPDFQAFQQGHALAVSHIAASVLAVMSKHVIERASRGALVEWNDAATRLKMAASCDVSLSPESAGPELSVTR